MSDLIFQDKTIEDMKINAALKYRKIYIDDEITAESMFKANYLVDRIIYLDDKVNIPIDKRSPIEIIINSPGGIIYYGLQLISIIESAKEMGYKIITTVQSIAMSMGFMILICGSERRALRHSRIMCHQPSSGSWYQELEKNQRDNKETELLWIKMKDIIIKYTNITDDQLENIKDRCFDWFMWPEEALELNIIDTII